MSKGQNLETIKEDSSQNSEEANQLPRPTNVNQEQIQNVVLLDESRIYKNRLLSKIPGLLSNIEGINEKGETLSRLKEDVIEKLNNINKEQVEKLSNNSQSASNYIENTIQCNICIFFQKF